MYHLLDNPKSVEILGCWANYTGQYTQVVGYTILGSIILYSPSSQEYLVLHPRINGNNAKQYGKYESLCAFEDEILKDKEFIQFCISPFSENDINNLIHSHGAPLEEEAFYPCPDPAIGGSGEIETFKKGNVWVG